jgi:ATP-binding cassette subfamily B protein
MIDSLVFQKLVLEYIYLNKGTLLLYMTVIMFTWPTETILLSRQYSDLVSSIKRKTSFDKVFNFVDNIKSQNVFGVLSLIFIIWIGLIIFYRIKYSMEQRLFPQYMTYVRSLLVNGVLKSNSNNFKEIKSGEYIAMINEITHVILGMVQMVSNKFLPLIIGLICISIYYSIVHPIMGLTFVTLGILRVILNISQGTNYAISCAVRDKAYFKLNEHFNDTFNNSMNIHLNNTLDFEEQKNTNLSKEYDIDQEEEMRARKEITWKANVFTILSFITIIVVAYYLYVKKKIPLSLLITIAFIEIKLVGTFIDYDSFCLTFFQKLGTIIATDKFLRKILKSEEEERKKCKIKNASIEITNLTFKYTKNAEPVINKMNLKIKSGERVGIIGRSGSGKTTLMKLLTGLHTTNEGSIEIGGCDIKDINTTILRDKITYVNQKTVLFNETVIDNIKYGNPELSTQHINEYLTKYDLHSIYSGLTKGIETNAGVNGSLLSLGMQKVTMILRGIFREGEIVILDEPLAGLDKNTREKILKICNSISRDRTLIVVTHDTEILSQLDNVYKLHELQKS